MQSVSAVMTVAGSNSREEKHITDSSPIHREVLKCFLVLVSQSHMCVPRGSKNFTTS